MATILAIDDDNKLLTLYRKILVRKGHSVLEAPNGDVGMRMYRDHKPDLVITDLIMPEKEGLETIMELKRINPAIKIIAVSGGGKIGPTTNLDTAKMLGASIAISKPFTIAEIEEAVEKLLNS